MTTVDRWLLPDGVEEILPAQAEHIEELRRTLLNLYRSWGYQLVIPPLMEFTDSLLIGLGSDVDMLTFKVIDQLSGRTLGIRADITPQVARIDAHSLQQDGVSRLCYAGSVLHTRPKTLMASRSPIQLGAELYGAQGLDADIEIISLMLETLSGAGLQDITLDLGHVAIYRALLAESELTAGEEATLFDALQRKAAADLTAAAEPISDPATQERILQLSAMHGDASTLECARELLIGVPDALAATENLAQLGTALGERFPDVGLYYDLAELRGLHYHTGMVFAAYVPGYGQAVANGGRYDDVGEVFGRARPATGFATDLKVLADLVTAPEPKSPSAISAPGDDSPELLALIRKLRTDGETVISKLGGEPGPACDRELKFCDGSWQLVPLPSFDS